MNVLPPLRNVKYEACANAFIGVIIATVFINIFFLLFDSKSAAKLLTILYLHKKVSNPWTEVSNPWTVTLLFTYLSVILQPKMGIIPEDLKMI